MREHQRCPKCRHGEVLHVPELRDTNWDSLALNSLKNIGFITRGDVNGQLEAFVCMRCGFVELYVANLLTLDVARIPNARVLVASAPDDPYR